MALVEEDGVRRRRRGTALEEAILDAAWAELEENGHDAFTVDGVAARAGTGRAVLYRRWSGKAELVRAAITHELRKETIVAPDTGTLRGDVIGLLERFNERRIQMAIGLVANLGEYHRATGATIADLREDVVGVSPSAMDAVIERAVARGEIDPARARPRVVRVPADLLRLEILMTMKPVPAQTIRDIVDQVFLPAVGADAGGAPGSPARKHRR